MGKRLPQHLQHHGIVVDQHYLDVAWHETYFFGRESV
jgi:hypothetical protein